MNVKIEREREREREKQRHVSDEGKLENHACNKETEEFYAQVVQLLLLENGTGSFTRTSNIPNHSSSTTYL